MTTIQAVLDRFTGAGIIPGVSFASLRDAHLDIVHACGIRAAHDRSPVDARTVFEAASLTKPVVAFIALQLVQEGLLDLHLPLEQVCGPYVEGDERASRITPWHVLTHTSGLPNIVRQEAPLRTHFPPGERFSYGSSAFPWLQRAMETVAGQALEPLAKERLFDPFEMQDSSLEWQSRFETNHAQGHEWDGESVPKRKVQSAHASWSLLTTASDYIRFVRAVLLGRDLSPALCGQWFAPAVRPRQGGEAEDLAGANPEDPDVAWGLGWGLEPAQECFFHWGHSPGFRAYVLGDRITRDAVVWFVNSARGLRLAHHILPVVLPGAHPSVEWMKIGPLDLADSGP
jgi:CubicO group peptidase (beta-lactamase class C family)